LVALFFAKLPASKAAPRKGSSPPLLLKYRPGIGSAFEGKSMEIFAYFGVLIFVIGGIGFLVAAFNESILWGIFCILVSPVALLFLLKMGSGPLLAHVKG